MRDHLIVFVNGQRFDVGHDEARMTLAAFLRESARLVGTKVVCNEGDCGACVVLVGRRDAAQVKLRYLPIDACITFLFQLDGTHVVTVEGLKSKGRTSTVQSAMIDCHGSQCGFCTPGFVMSIHGMIEQESELDDASLRAGLSGNLCRCTGYQQILDAGKMAATETPARMADLFDEPEIVAAINREASGSAFVPGTWPVALPRTLAEAIEMKSQLPDAAWVGGATDLGVLHNHRRLRPVPFVSLLEVAELQEVSRSQGHFCVGGGVTLTRLEETLQSHHAPFAAILRRFGSPPIRHHATLAGNLAGGSPIADATPFLIVVDAHLELAGKDGIRTVAIEDFHTGYRTTVLRHDELIRQIRIPLPGPNEHVALYKVSKRRDMDISTVTMGLRVTVEGGNIVACRYAIGGVGPAVLRLHAVEESLVGKTFCESTFAEAGELARNSIEPWDDVRGSSEFRLQLAESLMRKAYHELEDGSLLHATG